MSTLSFLQPFLHQRGTLRSGILDLLLILLGACLAYWLIPGPAEGLGY